MNCDVVYGLNIVITVVIYESYKEAWLNVVRNKLWRFSSIGVIFYQLSFNAINFFVWNGVPKAIQPAYKICWSILSHPYQVARVFELSSYENLRYKQGLVQRELMIRIKLEDLDPLEVSNVDKKTSVTGVVLFI